jgi:prepilin-type N-terminal cleavage/methylation domain-containing protein/prepilin-type processing-associated H-X9-DG protein
MFHPGRRHQRAFTLIELLVVVSIIAILATLLLPAIGMVRGMAQNSQCANNLRMLTLATMSYCNDYDSTLPYYDDVGNPWIDWYDRINDYIDNTYQGGVYKGSNAFRCPMASIEVGNQYQFWGRFSFQYSMNNNLRAWFNSNAWVGNVQPVPLSRTRAGQVLFQDGCIIGNPGLRYFHAVQYDTLSTWAKGAWPIGGNVGIFNDPSASTTQVPIVRHHGRVNQSFIDGHVAPVIGIWDAAMQTASFRR